MVRRGRSFQLIRQDDGKADALSRRLLAFDARRNSPARGRSPSVGDDQSQGLQLQIGMLDVQRALLYPVAEVVQLRLPD